MPTLLFRFPAGRYHATPWGHHVNEGLIEWPPSPWRLLRAFLATGYAKLGWPDAEPPALARNLIEKLASVPPTYVLPRAVAAHSRHYMPLARFKSGKEDTTLVFDTWARIDGEMAVTWEVDLEPDERDLFERLARGLGYLGRSESWIEARMAEAGEPLPAGEPAVPDTGAPPPGDDWEQVALLAPMSADGYAAWREQTVARIKEGLPQPRPGKKPTKAMIKKWAAAEEPYPPDLLACLQIQTNELHRHGWNRPPGSRKVFYWRRSGSLQVGRPLPPRAARPATVEAMLLALATPSGNEHALPHVSRTLPQAEILHNQLVGRLNGTNNPALTGRDENRSPLKEPHIHGHILPLDLNEDGHLDHVLLWAPMGFDATAQAAIRAVRRTFAKGIPEPLQVAVAAAGSLVEMQRLPGAQGETLRSFLEPASSWSSATPFVPSRYMKKRGKDSLFGQIDGELARRGLPRPGEILLLSPRDDDLARRHRHFVKTRGKGRPQPPTACGFTVQMRFERPVAGPLCLGYGSHFGLGLFRALRP